MITKEGRMTKRNKTKKFSPQNSPQQASMKTNLSNETVKIILDALGATKIEDVIQRDFADLDAEHDVDRERAKSYARRGRGSVRLSKGLFYTVKEFEERKKRVAALSLP
jgi:hypothetical protein